MKKTLVLVLVALLCASCALAEVPCEMKVVNCQEWVSLRAEPDSASQRFAEVKLGETVKGFYESNGDFTQCVYNGAVGYIMTQYLEVVSTVPAPVQPAGEPSVELALADGSVRAWKGLSDTAETIYLGRYDAQGQLLWDYATESLGSTELEALTVFQNEKAEVPMVMVYNSYYGLIALDAATGNEIWTLPVSEVSLGGSIVHAVSSDGTMYIGGYYGPDPAAISADGKLLWRASSAHNEEGVGETTFYWMDNIVDLSDGIAVHYENGGSPVWVGYDLKGKMVSWEAE